MIRAITETLASLAAIALIEGFILLMCALATGVL